MAISPVTFLKQVVDELKKVTWPTKDEVIRLTIAVVIISIIVAIYLGAIDALLTGVIDILLQR